MIRLKLFNASVHKSISLNQRFNIAAVAFEWCVIKERSNVLLLMLLKMQHFWDMSSSWHFKGALCLHLQGQAVMLKMRDSDTLKQQKPFIQWHSIISQKTRALNKPACCV